MTTSTKIIKLQGQRRNSHIQMRQDLREALANLHQHEQKLLSQFGVRSYQDITDSSAQGVFEEMHKAYKLGGEQEAVLTRHLEEGIEVVIDMSEAEAVTETVMNLVASINKNLRALSGE